MFLLCCHLYWLDIHNEHLWWAGNYCKHFITINWFNIKNSRSGIQRPLTAVQEAVKKGLGTELWTGLERQTMGIRYQRPTRANRLWHLRAWRGVRGKDVGREQWFWVYGQAPLWATASARDVVHGRKEAKNKYHGLSLLLPGPRIGQAQLAASWPRSQGYAQSIGVSFPVHKIGQKGIQSGS